MLALPGCTMETFWSWMVVVRMRVKITFRWIRNHVLRCLLAAGVVCCLPTCAKGSLVCSSTESFLPDFLLSVVLLALLGWELSFLIALFTPCLELRCRASCCYWLLCWVRCEFGGRSSRQNSGNQQFGWISFGIILDGSHWMRSTLVWKRLPSLLNSDTYFVFWPQMAPRENGRLRNCETLFLPCFLFCFW